MEVERSALRKRDWVRRAPRPRPQPRPAEPIPFHVPDIGEDVVQAVADVLRSGWVTTGPLCKKFEDRFATYVGAEHAAAVSSGTAALHLALRALGIGPGDEVITTPYTFVATSEAILYLQAKPVFVDIDPKTLNIDPEQVALAITPRTKAIMPVHIAGYPCEMDELMAVADRHGLPVVEDAAHALPTDYKGRRVGSIGTLTAFSFYATKNLTTGEGGMLTGNDQELIDKAKVLRLHGMAGDAWKRYANGGRWYYEVVDNGYKYNFTDMQAAMGLAQLEKLDDQQKARRNYDRLYRDALADCPLTLTPQEDEERRSAHHLFIVRLDPERTAWTRHGLIEALQREGIATSVHFIPVHLHPYYQEMGFRRGMYPEAERAYDHAVSLPFYPGMPASSAERLLDTVRGILLESNP